MLAKLKDEFAARECTVIALAIDTKDNNRKWIEDSQEVQECEVSFPIIADHNAEISRLLNLVKPKVSSSRQLKFSMLLSSFLRSLFGECCGRESSRRKT
jgi:alkyl hydroperoxide reductase subunit AhpC